ncbi:MAG TPA: sialidase family protein [Candidatus Paceibacterota bacterium]|nr:sialidase family protein [Candidatus Paceibacterota bacterium]
MFALVGGLSCLLAINGCKHTTSEVRPMQNVIVASEAGKFCGWPANNGLWRWDGGREILVGFSFGHFVEQEGHNLKGGSDATLGVVSRLARSLDGGRSWTVEDPDNFVGDGSEVTDSPGGFNFQSPGFALRVVGVGYHGSLDPAGSFFVSNDRGRTWRGAYRFGALMKDTNVQGMVLTARTRYLVTRPSSCLLFMSARPSGSIPGQIATDKSFVAETTDGGRSFHFVSWIVPLQDPYRAVMPAVGQFKDRTIIAALRRRDVANAQVPCWVDCYVSRDNGRSWNFSSRVGQTGLENGNPPALTVLKDGRVVCAYGDRSRDKLFARVSADRGKSWGAEIVLREDFQSDKFGDHDFGYPQLTTNERGEVVALYYWATKELPQQQIAATIWRANGKH